MKYRELKSPKGSKIALKRAQTIALRNARFGIKPKKTYEEENIEFFFKMLNLFKKFSSKLFHSQKKRLIEISKKVFSFCILAIKNWYSNNKTYIFGFIIIYFLTYLLYKLNINLFYLDYIYPLSIVSLKKVGYTIYEVAFSTHPPAYYELILREKYVLSAINGKNEIIRSLPKVIKLHWLNSLDYMSEAYRSSIYYDMKKKIISHFIYDHFKNDIKESFVSFYKSNHLNGSFIDKIIIFLNLFIACFAATINLIGNLIGLWLIGSSGAGHHIDWVNGAAGSILKNNFKIDDLQNHFFNRYESVYEITYLMSHIHSKMSSLITYFFNMKIFLKLFNNDQYHWLRAHLFCTYDYYAILMHVMRNAYYENVNKAFQNSSYFADLFYDQKTRTLNLKSYYFVFFLFVTFSLRHSLHGFGSVIRDYIHKFKLAYTIIFLLYLLTLVPMYLFISIKFSNEQIYHFQDSYIVSLKDLLRRIVWTHTRVCQIDEGVDVLMQKQTYWGHFKYIVSKFIYRLENILSKLMLKIVGLAQWCLSSVNTSYNWIKKIIGTAASGFAYIVEEADAATIPIAKKLHHIYYDIVIKNLNIFSDALTDLLKNTLIGVVTLIGGFVDYMTTFFLKSFNRILTIKDIMGYAPDQSLYEKDLLDSTEKGCPSEEESDLSDEVSNINVSLEAENDESTTTSIKALSVTEPTLNEELSDDVDNISISVNSTLNDEPQLQSEPKITYRKIYISEEEFQKLENEIENLVKSPENIEPMVSDYLYQLDPSERTKFLKRLYIYYTRNIREVSAMTNSIKKQINHLNDAEKLGIFISNYMHQVAIVGDRPSSIREFMSDDDLQIIKAHYEYHFHNAIYQKLHDIHWVFSYLLVSITWYVNYNIYLYHGLLPFGVSAAISEIFLEVVRRELGTSNELNMRTATSLLLHFKLKLADMTYEQTQYMLKLIIYKTRLEIYEMEYKMYTQKLKDLAKEWSDSENDTDSHSSTSSDLPLPPLEPSKDNTNLEDLIDHPNGPILIHMAPTFGLGEATNPKIVKEVDDILKVAAVTVENMQAQDELELENSDLL